MQFTPLFDSRTFRSKGSSKNICNSPTSEDMRLEHKIRSKISAKYHKKSMTRSKRQHVTLCASRPVNRLCCSCSFRIMKGLPNSSNAIACGWPLKAIAAIWSSVFSRRWQRKTKDSMRFRFLHWVQQFYSRRPTLGPRLLSELPATPVRFWETEIRISAFQRASQSVHDFDNVQQNSTTGSPSVR